MSIPRPVLIAALAAASAVGAQEPPSVPAPGGLNPVVLKVLSEYPTDGTHKYYWPKGGAWEGTTRDLDYGGSRIATGDPQKRAYCCGITFEVFFRSFERWCAETKRPFRIGSLDAGGLTRFRQRWYGIGSGRGLVTDALEADGIGARVADPEQARPGDFAQLWRKNGSGHSVIFLEWVRDAGGARTGISYWSANGGRGISRATETFGAPNWVTEVHLGRVGVAPPKPAAPEPQAKAAPPAPRPAPAPLLAAVPARGPDGVLPLAAWVAPELADRR